MRHVYNQKKKKILRYQNWSVWLKMDYREKMRRDETQMNEFLMKSQKGNNFIVIF